MGESLQERIYAELGLMTERGRSDAAERLIQQPIFTLLEKCAKESARLEDENEEARAKCADAEKRLAVAREALNDIAKHIDGFKYPWVEVRVYRVLAILDASGKGET